jgi:hypothetical protein
MALICLNVMPHCLRQINRIGSTGNETSIAGSVECLHHGGSQIHAFTSRSCATVLKLFQVVVNLIQRAGRGGRMVGYQLWYME